MKRILSLLSVFCFVGVAAQAQSTMPAIGANTPKGEVAKTDASLNPTGAARLNNASSTTKKSSGKRTHKMKMTSNKPMGNM